MNKQCIKCGHIMLVPDIPLPEGYTQKCIACGERNDVSESYEAVSYEADSSRLDESFTSSINPNDIIDFSESSSQEFKESGDSFSLEPAPLDQLSIEKILTDKFNTKIAELQSQIDRLAQRTPAPSVTEERVADTGKNPLLDIPVAENEALFCSEHRGMANLCAKKLRQQGVQTHIVGHIEEATKQVTEHAYQIIIIDHRMLQGKPKGADFLKMLHTITLPVRRQQVVALLTPGIETGESQVFYQWGLDVNIHFDDLEALTEIIFKTIQIKKDLYNEYSGIQIPE